MATLVVGLEFIALVGGGGVTVTSVQMLRVVHGACSQVDLGHVAKVFWEPIRGIHDLLR
jgi:hypothetical protein